jgi:hypothetical protein
MQRSSVSDPNPDPPDSHVFGSPGSGSIIQSFGSGSFYNSAKIVRKTLISTVLCKKTFLKYVFCWRLEGQWWKQQDPDQNLDPDPLVRGMDPRIRIHTKCHRSALKSYRCPYCTMLFAQPNSQQNHLRIHRGQKPFDCSRTLFSVRQYEILHTVVNPFSLNSIKNK